MLRTITIFATALSASPSIAEPPAFSGFATECTVLPATAPELEFGACRSQWFHIEYRFTPRPEWFWGKSIDFALDLIAESNPGFDATMLAGIALPDAIASRPDEFPPFPLGRPFEGFCVRGIATPRVVGRVDSGWGGAPAGDGSEYVTRCFAEDYGDYLFVADFFPRRGSAPLAEQALITGMMSELR